MLAVKSSTDSAGSSMSINQVVRQEVKKDNFTSFVNDFSQASVFEPVSTLLSNK